MERESVDQIEDLITNALSDYQSQLDGKESDLPDGASGTDVPGEMQAQLDRFRHCLDLISQSRATKAAADSTSRQQDATPGYPIPSRIARFQIRERLGIGGFGIVFRGFDPVFEREVAIKIPRPEILGTPELIERFASEANVVSQLQHPNIVPVYESDVFEIVPYIVMPYIPGKTLSQWRAGEEKVPPRVAAEIVRELAATVSYAHEQGILHRDLKPGNVLLAERKTPPVGDEPPFIPKLTDFGLAKCARMGRNDSRTGALIGTACYMSPEQAEGRIRQITARSDVYGLGVILYELLAGVPPFNSNNQLRTIQRILRDDPPPFRSQNCSVPLDLEVICLKCLEKDPSNRYPTALALVEDLQAFLNGDPIKARPISWYAKMAKLSRRHPTRAALVLAGVLSFVALTGVSLWYNSRLSELLIKADAERRLAQFHEHEARRLSYVSDMRNAKITGDHDNTAYMLKLLDRHRPKNEQPDVRDFAWWHLRREYDEASRVLGYHDHQATSVAMTRDGKIAASGGTDQVIRLWSLETLQNFLTLPGHERGEINSLGFSPDGKYLLSTGDDEVIRVWDIAAKQEKFVFRDHHARITEAQYSPKGDLIASAGHDGTIRLWNPLTGEPLGTLNCDNKIFCLAFNPRFNELASAGVGGAVKLWNLNALKTPERAEIGSVSLVDDSERIRSLVFSPDGRRLYAGSTNHEISVISLPVRLANPTIIRQKEKGTAFALVYPPGGSLIAPLSSSEVHVWDPLDENLPGEWLRGHSQGVLSAASSRDGSSLITASLDGTVRYWPNIRDRMRINVAQTKGPKFKSDRMDYEIQWQGPYLAADFRQEEVQIFKMPERTVQFSFAKSNDDAFVLSSSGKHLLICQPNGLATCYQLETGNPIWIEQFRQRERGFYTDFAAINDNDELVVMATGDEMAIFSLRNPTDVRYMKHPDKVWQVAFVQRGNGAPMAVTACDDGFVRLWELRSGALVREHRVSDSRTYSVSVSPDQAYLVTDGDDRKVRVWRLSTMQEVVSLPSNELPGPSRYGFLEGSKLLARSNLGLTVWSIPEETELLAFPDCGQYGPLTACPDGKQMAIPQHGWIRIIDGRPMENQ